MANSPTLGLTLMSASQAQKEVVFNEFLIAMDALFRGVVISATLTAPPGSPSAGDTYIIGSGATGAWSGQDHNIAFWFNGWQFVTAKDHMRLYDQTATVWRVYHANTTSWEAEPASTVSVLNDLTNVQGSPSDGMVLTYVLADGKWEPKAITFPSLALSALSGVQVTEGSAIDGKALAWNQTDHKWEAKPFLSSVPAFMSLPGVSSPTGLADAWVAVYNAAGPGLTFVNPSSIIAVSSLNQVGDVAYPVGGVGAIPSGASLVWNGATWAPSSVAPATIGITGIINGPGSMDGNAGKILRVNSVESAWEYVPNTLANLADVSVTEGSGIDGYVLGWDSGAGKWKALAHSSNSLQALTDVAVSEGPGIDGRVLTYVNSDAKWEAKALNPIAWSGGWSDIQNRPSFAAVATSGAYSDLSGRPSLAAVATSGVYNDLSGKPALAAVATSGAYSDLTGKPTFTTTLANLTDVNVTEGAGIDGYVLKWDKGTSKWLASATGGGSATLAALTDVQVTEGAGIDNKVLYWSNGSSKWLAGGLAAVAWSGNYSDLSGKPTSSNYSLAGLSDVNVTEGPSIDGRYLKWDNATSKWVADTPSVGPSTLATLTDVNVSEGSGIDGYVLKWNNATSKWVASASGGGGASALNGLSDVTLTSPSNGQALVYDATAGMWKNSTVSGGGGGGAGSGVTLTRPTIVQSAVACGGISTITMGAAPTPGNLLVMLTTHWSNGVTLPNGWTQVLYVGGGTNDGSMIGYKIASSADGVTLPTNAQGNTAGMNVAVFEISGANPLSPLIGFDYYQDATATSKTVTAYSGLDQSLSIGMFATTNGSALPTLSASGASVTAGPTTTSASGSGSPRAVAAFSANTTNASDVITGAWGSTANSYGQVVVLMPAANVDKIAVSALTDATLDTLRDNDVLAYDKTSAMWKNKPALGGGFTPPNPAVITTVTKFGGSTRVYTTVGGVPGLSVRPGVSDADGTLYGLFQNVPSGAFSSIVKASSLNISNGGGWKACGIALVHPTNGKGMFFMRNGQASPNLYMCQFGSGGGYTGGSPVDQTTLNHGLDFLHVDFDGTDTITFALSRDGVNKLTWKTYSAGAKLGAAPVLIGPGWSGQGDAAAGPIYTFQHYHVGSAATNGL